MATLSSSSETFLKLFENVMNAPLLMPVYSTHWRCCLSGTAGVVAVAAEGSVVQLPCKSAQVQNGTCVRSTLEYVNQQTRHRQAYGAACATEQ